MLQVRLVIQSDKVFTCYLKFKTGVAGCNNKILISDTSLNLGINKKINEGSSLTNATRTSTKGPQEPQSFLKVSRSFLKVRRSFLARKEPVNQIMS